MAVLHKFLKRHFFKVFDFVIQKDLLLVKRGIHQAFFRQFGVGTLQAEEDESAR